MAELNKKGVNINPTQGSGDSTLTLKAQTPNQGNRVKQTATFTITAPGVDEAKTLTASLLPKAEFVSFTDGSEIAIDKTGGAVTITGKSNSAKLTFTLGELQADEHSEKNMIQEQGTISTHTFTAAGEQTVNGATIKGDPGAVAEYTFSITFQANANDTISQKTQVLNISAEGGQKAALTMKQTAGDPFLNINPESIDVPQDGSTVTVQVDTNTTFTVA